MSLLDNLLLKAKEVGLRRTKALKALLNCLEKAERPMTLGELNADPILSETCDKATVFRLLQRLSEKGMVRRLGLHERAAYFTLLIPGIHQDYLICTDCGSINTVKSPCPVHQLEEEIRQKTGFTNLYHELEFFGTCPKCS